jgi:hypothetical protein
VDAVTGGEQAQAVVEDGGGVVLVEPARLPCVLLVLEALQTGLLGILAVARGVLVGPIRVLRDDVAEVAEHEELAGPGVAVGLDDGGLARCLDLLVVGDELRPRSRDLEPKLGVDLLVVEDRACLGCAEWGAVEAVVGGHHRGHARVELLRPRLVGEVDQVLVGVQRHQQRAGVVVEHVRHLAGGELRLVEVVALGATGLGLVVDLDAGLLGERLGEGLADRDVRRAVRRQEGDRDVAAAATAAGGLAAATASAAVAAGCERQGCDAGGREDDPSGPSVLHPYLHVGNVLVMASVPVQLSD